MAGGGGERGQEVAAVAFEGLPDRGVAGPARVAESRPGGDPVGVPAAVVAGVGDLGDDAEEILRRPAGDVGGTQRRDDAAQRVECGAEVWLGSLIGGERVTRAGGHRSASLGSVGSGASSARGSSTFARSTWRRAGRRRVAVRGSVPSWGSRA